MHQVRPAKPAGGKERDGKVRSRVTVRVAMAARFWAGLGGLRVFLGEVEGVYVPKSTS